MRNLVFLLLIVFLTALPGCKKEVRLTTSSPEAGRIYTQAEQQYERFYYSDAKDLFEKAIALDSTFAMAWARLGIVNLMVKDEPEALADIKHALALAGRVTEREQLFIRMWYHRMTFDARAAAATADSLANLYPDEKEVYLFRGNLYEQAKNYDAAIRSYQRAIQADTGYALAVMTLGYAYSSTGDQDKAIAQMQRYIRLAPNEPDPRASYADILMRAGRFDEALEQYKQSLDIKPDYWYSIREIGRIYAIQGKLKAAEEQFNRSFQYLPQNRQLEATRLQVRGSIEFQRGQYEKAAEFYRQALDVDTTSLDAAFSCVTALARTGRFDEAHSLTDRIEHEFRRRGLLDSPLMMGLFIVRSLVLMHEGQLPQALSLCDSALNYSSSFARGAVYRQMAEIFLRQKAYEQALGSCEDGLAITPNSPEILLTLTRIYSAKGDRRMTAEIGNRLLALWKDADPDFANRREVLHLVGHAAAT